MKQICPACKGTGFIFLPSLEKVTCSRCDGTGKISDVETLYPAWSKKR